jgi:cytochrome c556
MKPIQYITGCLLAASFFVSCTESKPEETAEEWQPDMYEASELVMVMREMYDDNLKLKEEIAKGIVPAEVPERYRDILTATATNPDELNDLYYAMAQKYLSDYEALTKADASTVQEKYNILINTCVSCHQNYCLGPIPKIEKLYLK